MGHPILTRAAPLGVAAGLLIAPSAVAGAAQTATQVVPVTPAIDRLIIRGSWRAAVTLGTPSVTIVGSPAALRAIDLVRHPDKLEVLQQRPVADGTIPEVHVTVRRLRGLATSGRVTLAISDRSDTPLFLDLSQATVAHVTGALPQVRLTASGTADLDLCGLLATDARVHARQASRVGIRATQHLVIVAVDGSRVVYIGPPQTTIDRRNQATVDPVTAAARAANAARCSSR